VVTSLSELVKSVEKLFSEVVHEVLISELVINFFISEILSELFLGACELGSEFLGNVKET
jgi:hypothetical protein